MHLAVSGPVTPRWTDEIHDEWISNVLADRFNLTPERLQRTRQFMEQAVPDAQVTGDERLIPTLALPDPNDRHVLALAIHVRAAVIVTFNVKDCPRPGLAAYGLKGLTPDDLVCRLLDSDPQTTASAVEALRLTLRNPAYTPSTFLERLGAVGLPEAARRLKPDIA